MSNEKGTNARPYVDNVVTPTDITRALAALDPHSWGFKGARHRRGLVLGEALHPRGQKEQRTLPPCPLPAYPTAAETATSSLATSTATRTTIVVAQPPPPPLPLCAEVADSRARSDVSSVVVRRPATVLSTHAAPWAPPSKASPTTPKHCASSKGTGERETSETEEGEEEEKTITRTPPVVNVPAYPAPTPSPNAAPQHGISSSNSVTATSSHSRSSSSCDGTAYTRMRSVHPTDSTRPLARTNLFGCQRRFIPTSFSAGMRPMKQCLSPAASFPELKEASVAPPPPSLLAGANTQSVDAASTTTPTPAESETGEADAEVHRTEEEQSTQLTDEEASCVSLEMQAIHQGREAAVSTPPATTLVSEAASTAVNVAVPPRRSNSPPLTPRADPLSTLPPQQGAALERPQPRPQPRPAEMQETEAATTPRASVTSPPATSSTVPCELEATAIQLALTPHAEKLGATDAAQRLPAAVELLQAAPTAEYTSEGQREVAPALPPPPQPASPTVTSTIAAGATLQQDVPLHSEVSRTAPSIALTRQRLCRIPAWYRQDSIPTSACTAAPLPQTSVESPAPVSATKSPLPPPPPSSLSTSSMSPSMAVSTAPASASATISSGADRASPSAPPAPPSATATVAVVVDVAPARLECAPTPVSQAQAQRISPLPRLTAVEEQAATRVVQSTPSVKAKAPDLSPVSPSVTAVAMVSSELPPAPVVAGPSKHEVSASKAEAVATSPPPPSPPLMTQNVQKEIHGVLPSSADVVIQPGVRPPFSVKNQQNRFTRLAAVERFY